MKREVVIADSLMFTYYLVFCGSLHPNDRQMSMEHIRGMLKDVG
jgi:hypothetical protein